MGGFTTFLAQLRTPRERTATTPTVAFMFDYSCLIVHDIAPSYDCNCWFGGSVSRGMSSSVQLIYLHLR